MKKLFLTALVSAVMSYIALDSKPAAAQMWSSSYSSCYAYTICPNGMPISCKVWASGGPFGAACEWAVLPGQWVGCRGFNAYGQWAVFQYSCF
jgi:hypothetical protein